MPRQAGGRSVLQKAAHVFVTIQRVVEVGVLVVMEQNAQEIGEHCWSQRNSVLEV